MKTVKTWHFAVQKLGEKTDHVSVSSILVS